MAEAALRAGGSDRLRLLMPWVRKLIRLPCLRLRDRRFWLIQAMVLGATALHIYTEVGGFDEPYGTFHHIPVTLYLVPVAYASLHFRLEGGILTGIWAAVLTIPNMVLWHTTAYMWTGEVTQLAVVVLVGSVLSWRVEREVRQRTRAEQATVRLQVSEEKYRNLFEAAGDAIMVFGSDGGVQTANKAAARLTGYEPAQLRAARAETLFGESAWTAMRAAAQAGPADPIRVPLTTRTGAEAMVEAGCALLENEHGAVIQAVMRDVTEQQRQQQNLRSYARLVTRAQEEERRRIARELHDEPVQAVAILCRELATVLDSSSQIPETARSGLGSVRERAETALGLLRRFSRELRPSVLDDLGLMAAIKGLTSELKERRGIDARVETSGIPGRLPADVELGLFRIAQEALRNIEKYSGATHATVSVAFETGRVVLTVRDDGRGFAVPARLGDLTAEGKLGLIGMEERVRLLGGTLAVASSPGKGTTVTATILI